MPSSINCHPQHRCGKGYLLFTCVTASHNQRARHSTIWLTQISVHTSSIVFSRGRVSQRIATLFDVERSGMSLIFVVTWGSFAADISTWLWTEKLSFCMPPTKTCRFEHWRCPCCNLYHCSLRWDKFWTYRSPWKHFSETWAVYTATHKPICSFWKSSYPDVLIVPLRTSFLLHCAALAMLSSLLCALATGWCALRWNGVVGDVFCDVQGIRLQHSSRSPWNHHRLWRSLPVVAFSAQLLSFYMVAAEDGIGRHKRIKLAALCLVHMPFLPTRTYARILSIGSMDSLHSVQFHMDDLAPKGLCVGNIRKFPKYLGRRLNILHLHRFLPQLHGC